MSSACRACGCLLILLTVVLATCSSTTENDFRFISFQDLQLSFDRFSEPGVISYSQLLFDVAGSQVLVGARDALYRLRVQNLKLLEKAVWPSPENKTSLCLVKGQSEQNCHNYIKVLLSHGKKIFACGTNAFSPQCSWRGIENITEVTEWVDGIAKCPYNPHANITALVSYTGEYYVGGPTDFSGSDAAIYRSNLGTSTGTDKRHVLRTNQYNSKWLNEPQFVGSFETDKFVYIVFREAAVEYINCGKIIYSRIARVCKNDSGGQLMLKDNWTTFVKARLNCSINSDYPFYFNEIQGMSYIEEENIMYATFTTPTNGIAGSAICAFNMSAINEAFRGPFKHQEHPGSTWEQHTSPHQRHFECKADSLRSNHLVDSSRYQLMNNAVQSTSLNPLHVAELERFTHITIDVLATKLHTSVHVMYVATLSGLVKKITVLPRTQETCVVEVWSPVPFDAPGSIQTLRYLKDTNSVYIGSEHHILRIDAQHCRRHVSRSSCLNAMDPYCGWNELQELCTPAPNGNPLARFWTQSVTSCPILDAPVDGSWSNWSDWFICEQKNGSDIDSSDHDQCLCRTRQCNNPAPQNGGTSCTGVSVMVTNCTVHGGWTPWSAWSACSQTCGMAVKTRRRTCANPAPAHGGRVCVGQDYSEIYCTNSPPCPAHQQPPRDGQWSPWSSWEECSATCGGGYRMRRRRCDNPPPLSGGQECQGSHVDYELCNTDPCPEFKKMSPWSPWMISSNGTSLSDGYIEKRFRCACRAQAPDAALIKVSIAKEEERFCRNDGSCTRRDHDDSEHKWSDWSSWSDCTAPCGGGVQFRTRQCEGRQDECMSPSYISRSCNTHRCKGEWSCWTEWSQCSVTCGIGIKHRKRTCLSGKNKEMPGNNCEGINLQEEPCEMPPCASLLGWEKWTTWSLCDENNEQHRKRKCRTSNPGPHLCQGDSVETRMCLSDQSNDLSAMDIQYDKSIHAASISTGVVLAYCFAGFIVGLAFACFLFFFYMRRKKPRLPSSPHYLPSKQNPYITVPLQEVSSKRHYGSPSSSSNGSIMVHSPGNNTGTLKLYSKSIGDYDTATIKRNSHSLNNGHTKTDPEMLDKYY